MVLCLGSHSRAPAAHDEAPASRRAGPTQDRAPFVTHKRAAAAPGLRVRTPPTGMAARKREGFAIPHVLGQDEPFVLRKDLRSMSGPSRHGAGLLDNRHSADEVRAESFRRRTFDAVNLDPKSP
jgi:hypothetical protein